ncbi:MAG: hypothetical protein QM537_02410 [Candidatus Symbiobacter sp.]|nr:hypothetical protein [Candidatus Symbiobacter sp.]
MNKHVDINVEDYDIFADPSDSDGDEIWPPDDAEFVVHPDSEVGLALRVAVAQSEAGLGIEITDLKSYFEELWVRATSESSDDKHTDAKP